MTLPSAAPREAPKPVGSSPDSLLEDEINLWHYAGVFGRHWVLLLFLAALGAIGGYAVSRLRPVVYEGVTTLIVLPPARGETRAANPASFRALLANFSLAANVIRELGLDNPPDRLTPHKFLERALTVEELAGTNLIRVRLRLSDPARAADASRRLAEQAVALNERIGAQESTSVRDQMKAHLEEAAIRMKTAESQLLTFQRTAQVDLLKEETDAILEERGEQLKLVISIEGEKARLHAAEQEIKKQEPILSVGRSVRAEDALRRAAGNSERAEQEDAQRRDIRNAERARTEDALGRSRDPKDALLPPTAERDPSAAAEMLDLSNPFVNPVYQTLDFQIATSRARLAALERQRRELVEVKKLGGSELPQLSELYRRQIELARLQTGHELTKKVYTDLAVRYEETRTDALSRSSQLQVVDPAIPPERPVSRKGAQAAVLGLVVGLVLAGLAVLVLENRQSTR
jgi:uncharacterized protein involved in exopolysaccharide biosynthesis